MFSCRARFSRALRLWERHYHSRSGVYGHRTKLATTTSSSDSESDSDLGELAAVKNRVNHSNVYRLVEAYRRYGHRKSRLDPLNLKQPEKPPELELTNFGIKPSNNNDIIPLEGIFNCEEDVMRVSDLIHNLEVQYCGSIAAEFEHLETVQEREWFAKQFETKNRTPLPPERQGYLAKLMLKCQEFDKFLASKFTTVKRYGGEGGESMMCIFDEIFEKSSKSGITDLVICMPHRGRLNFMATMLKFPPVVMFQKMKGMTEIPSGAKGSGDVLSHLYTSVDLDYNNESVHVSLIPNPSHLEANNPVAVGKTRAKQQRHGVGDYSGDDMARSGDGVLCVQVHGDASFTAQGVVAETFSFAECPHFNVGGSIHLIVNNQIGFTTEGDRGRSSRYCSDQGKINSYPVLHVNADSPEDVIKATSIAMEYREAFRKDPIMYNVIRSRPSIPDQYADKLVTEGVCTKEELSSTVKDWQNVLLDDLSKVDTSKREPFHLQDQWAGLSQASDHVTTWQTGVEADILKFVGAKSVEVPSRINVHPTIQKTHIERRVQKMLTGAGLDWGICEALAIGSLLHQGFNVRISGQDVGRATFSHRHAMIVDQQTDEMWIPLNDMSPEQKGFLEIANSSLSEEAVLGFEYGMSLESPRNLTIWEAQFGDFFNGAQPIIDTYVTSGETKWLLQSGLVMLLPNGMDGAGPEHSSCRIERFLQMCDSKEDRIDGDDINFQIVNPTTPAQYFHLLRRQIVRNFRKPLVVAAPKILLRHPQATSTLADLGPGTTFSPVLADSNANPSSVTRHVFCTGKHYYTLLKERDSRQTTDMAITRIESLCPFPAAEIQAEVKKYPNASDFIWSQEEHRNMGPWTFIAPRFENIVGCKLRYVGRDTLGTPAVGIGSVHVAEAEQVIKDTFNQ
ncbi:hypothetical protein ScPMuIL_013602 [Solemya velum]